MAKRVLILSIYVESADEYLPTLVAIEKRGDRMSAYATRFGYTNNLIESLGTKQDLHRDEYKQEQDRLVSEIKRSLSEMTLEDYNKFIDESSPTKLGVALGINRKGRR